VRITNIYRNIILSNKDYVPILILVSIAGYIGCFVVKKFFDVEITIQLWFLVTGFLFLFDKRLRIALFGIIAIVVMGFGLALFLSWLV
jgi:hypothetical protein